LSSKHAALVTSNCSVALYGRNFYGDKPLGDHKGRPYATKTIMGSVALYGRNLYGDKPLGDHKGRPYATKTIMGSVALYGRPDLSGRGQALRYQF